MFNNQIFDSWLNKKSDEILSKVDRETISTEEMIILVLKAQTNHFYHVDIDMKKGMADLDCKIIAFDQKFEKRIADLDKKIEKGLADLDNKIEKGLVDLDNKIEKGLADLDNKIIALDTKFEKRFQQVDARMDSLERRIDVIDHKIDNRFMWTIGTTVAMSAGIYLKLFLG